jgi:hypothetical protein
MQAFGKLLVRKETTRWFLPCSACAAGRLAVPPKPLPGETFCLEKRKCNRSRRPEEIGVIEKLREEELEEARSIQSVMLPAEPLRAGGVRIATSKGGGDLRVMST